MFDILFQHVFVCGCTDPMCTKLYDLSVKDEPNVYVYFDDNVCKVVDFIGTKYSSHPEFECCPYGDGSLVKFPSHHVVHGVITEYKSYFNINEIQGTLHKPKETKICEVISNESKALDAVCQLLQSAFSGWKDEVEQETNKTLSCKLVNESEDYSGLKPENSIWNDYSANKIFKAEENHKIAIPDSILEFNDKERKIVLDSSNWDAKKDFRNYGLHSKVSNPLLHVVSYLKNNYSSQASLSAGWTSLKEVWGIGPAIFNQDEFRWLQCQTTERRDCLLLNLAISDLSETSPSVQLGYLSQRPSLLCLRYLAGTCSKNNCVGVHPTHTPGWNALRDMWGISYLDIDPYVLTYLCQQPRVTQESILTALSSCDIRSIRNLSQYIGELVDRYVQAHCA